jgi:hypothetical protein
MLSGVSRMAPKKRRCFNRAPAPIAMEPCSHVTSTRKGTSVTSSSAQTNSHERPAV